MAYQKQTRLPPGCGADITTPTLYNPYIHDPNKGFMAVRRLRVCLKCKAHGTHDQHGVFTCPRCNTLHYDNLTAPRAYDRFLLLAGRGGGKTKSAAEAAREEMLIPNSIGWVMGPNYKILHDSTFPTLVRLIDPSWVKRWDAEHMELTLTNGSMVAFRSLEDPDRARGPHGISWGWFDEAAQCPERAYDVFEPTLIKAGGIVICSTTVLGFDWTYDKIEKRALVYKEPGYWTCKWWTEENPIFRSSPVMMRQIERARRTMDPKFFAQEYRAERANAQGLIYDYELLEQQLLRDDEAVKRLIPEWPQINPSRPVIIGLDSGADHPFGAVMMVVTPSGIVVVRDYLERQRAISQHLEPILTQFGVRGFTNVTWAANKNEKNLRLEWGLKGVGIVQAESKHEIGIQRTQSWLYTKKFFFAYTAQRTYEQMRAYRYADNTKMSTGEKTDKEKVFKLKDELPDGVRYGLMAWPQLPDADEGDDRSEREKRRWDAFDDRTRLDLERMRDYTKRQTQGSDLDETEAGYPLGEFHDGWVDDDLNDFR